MSANVKVTMLLCGSATVKNGLLEISGGCWQVTKPESFKHAVALQLQMPWERGGSRLRVTLELQDADGEVAAMPVPWSAEKARVNLELDIDRPSTTRMPIISVPVVADVPRLTLKPNARYSWRLFVDGETRPGWQLPFATLES